MTPRPPLIDLHRHLDGSVRLRTIATSEAPGSAGRQASSLSESR